MDTEMEPLKRLAVAQNDAICLLVDHVRALALLNAAILGTLNDDARAVVRTAALSNLGQGPEHDQTAALIEAFTGGADAGAIDHQVITAGLMDGLGRLQ